MGRKNKKYYKDMHQQMYERLVSMQAFGESKKDAIANGTDRDKIFSFNTYKTYWKHTKYFIKWMKENHPEVTTMKKARKYVEINSLKEVNTAVRALLCFCFGG